MAPNVPAIHLRQPDCRECLPGHELLGRSGRSLFGRRGRSGPGSGSYDSADLVIGAVLGVEPVAVGETNRSD